MRINSNKSIFLLNDKERAITSTRNIANTIGWTLSDVSKSDSYSELFLPYKRNAKHSRIYYRTDSSLNYISPFTENELKNSFKKSHLSAQEPDGIIYLMTKYLSQNPINNLLHLFNRIFTEHVLPAAWHDAIVITFPKPGKHPTDQKKLPPNRPHKLSVQNPRKKNGQ